MCYESASQHTKGISKHVTQIVLDIPWQNSLDDNLIWSIVSFQWSNYHWLDIDYKTRITGNAHRIVNPAYVDEFTTHIHSNNLGYWTNSTLFKIKQK